MILTDWEGGERATVKWVPRVVEKSAITRNRRRYEFQKVGYESLQIVWLCFDVGRGLTIYGDHAW